MVRYIHTVILALLLPFAAVGQGKTFNVEGHIMSSGFDFEEPEGDPFIKVSLKDSSLKVIDSDETGFDGKYRFENIPEGTYRLCFKALGYYDFDTVINIGSDVRIDTLFHDDLSTQLTEIIHNLHRHQSRMYHNSTDFYILTYLELRKAIYSIFRNKDTFIAADLNTLVLPLKGIRIKKNYSLKVDGVYGSLYACKKPDTKKVSDNEILSCFHVDFTPQGIWSAFLLATAENYLPKAGSNVYLSSSLVFSADEVLHALGQRGKSKEKNRQSLRLLPKLNIGITMIDKNTAELTAYFWNDWEGLVEQRVLAERVDKSVKFTFYNPEHPHPRTSYNIIVPYECMFKVL